MTTNTLTVPSEDVFSAMNLAAQLHVLLSRTCSSDGSAFEQFHAMDVFSQETYLGACLFLAEKLEAQCAAMNA